MAAMAEDVLAMPASADLDRAVDTVVYGTPTYQANGHPAPPSLRPWSSDASSTHTLYDPIAKESDLCLGYDLFHNPPSFIVLGPDGRLVAAGQTATLAMLRAVLAHYLAKQQPAASSDPAQRKRKGK